MDRLEFRTKFSSRIEKFRLEDFDVEVSLRCLTAAERSEFHERLRTISASQDSAGFLGNVTRQLQCFVVSRGLVDEKGNRLYVDGEEEKLAEEVPCTVLDMIHLRIMIISKLHKEAAEEALKNLSPAPNASSNSDSQQSSDGGTPINSLVN
jgi:hypothetical protein